MNMNKSKLLLFLTIISLGSMSLQAMAPKLSPEEFSTKSLAKFQDLTVRMIAGTISSEELRHSMQTLRQDLDDMEERLGLRSRRPSPENTIQIPENASAVADFLQRWASGHLHENAEIIRRLQRIEQTPAVQDFIRRGTLGFTVLASSSSPSEVYKSICQNEL
jgi:hypothetical protein